MQGPFVGRRESRYGSWDSCAQKSLFYGDCDDDDYIVSDRFKLTKFIHQKWNEMKIWLDLKIMTPVGYPEQF